MSHHPYTNRLIHSSSPYLLQHAHNPVDWHEWGEEAFATARRENKPVLVSIGYSACHWCHVMEKECFENIATATIMNKYFVCIKVDREERPDVDQVYMDAVQLITGRGGWPLNAFTLPDGRPLHGGTYFPKPQWDQLLLQLAELCQNRPQEAEEYAQKLTEGVRSLDLASQPVSHGSSLPKPDELYKKWSEQFDWENGGYDRAPKFPLPNTYEFLLQYAHYSGNKQAADFSLFTLIKMAQGGIYDQLGGGFSRYSVDALWLVPHFEKMLYDNAQLIALYAMAFRKTGVYLFRKITEESIGFVLRELYHPSGAFFSALDADSEGVEGKYYVWTKNELKVLLGEHEPVFSAYYEVTEEGNWEEGSNILHVKKSFEQLGNGTGLDQEQLVSIIGECRLKLLEAREKRVRPGLDDKCITCWNGLMLRALCEAWSATGKKLYLDVAEKNASLIRNELYQDGHLYRIWKNGKVSINAFAEDYAAVIEGLISLYHCVFDEQYLLFAHELMDKCLEAYYDKEKSLFYFTSVHDPALIARKTDTADDVIPSANSMLAHSLLKLGHLFGKSDWIAKADAMLLRVRENLLKFPSWYSNWALLMLYRDQGLHQVVVTGPDTEQNLALLRKEYLPGLLLVKATGESRLAINQGRYHATENRIYVCRDTVCSLPLGSVGEALKTIKG